MRQSSVLYLSEAVLLNPSHLLQLSFGHPRGSCGRPCASYGCSSRRWCEAAARGLPNRASVRLVCSGINPNKSAKSGIHLLHWFWFCQPCTPDAYISGGGSNRRIGSFATRGLQCTVGQRCFPRYSLRAWATHLRCLFCFCCASGRCRCAY